MDWLPWSDPLVQRKDGESEAAPLGIWLRKKMTERGIETMDGLRIKLGVSPDALYNWFRPHVAAVPSRKRQDAIVRELDLNQRERLEFQEVVLRQQQEANNAIHSGATFQPKRTRSSGSMAAVRPEGPRADAVDDVYPSRAEAIELSRGKVDPEVLVAIGKRRLKSDVDPGLTYWIREIAEAQRARNALGEEISGLKPLLPVEDEVRKGKKK